MSTGIPDTLLKTNGTAICIAPRDGKGYTFEELKTLLCPESGIPVLARIDTLVAPGTALVINEEADIGLNHQAARIAGRPQHGNALLTTNDKVACLLPRTDPRTRKSTDNPDVLDTILKTNGKAHVIRPRNHRAYTLDELKDIIQGDPILITPGNPQAHGHVLVVNREPNTYENPQAAHWAGTPIYDNALLTTPDKVQCLVPQPNTKDATGVSHTSGPAPKTVKRLSPAQAEARKREVAQEIHNLVLKQTHTDPYCDAHRVEVYRPSYDRNNSRIEHIVLHERNFRNHTITGTGPYLATVTRFGTPLRLVRGDTELKALKALLTEVKANPVW